MKNRELINQLKKFNPDADVTLTTSEDIQLSYIISDAKGEREQFSKTNTPIVFIEPCDWCD